MSELAVDQVEAPLYAVGNPNAVYVNADGSTSPVSVNQHYANGNADLSLSLSGDLTKYVNFPNAVSASGSVSVVLSNVPYGADGGNWYVNQPDEVVQ